MSAMHRRAVCLALVATVVFRVPMMRLGGNVNDVYDAISPLDVVASQLVLPVMETPGGTTRTKPTTDSDPGDLVRTLLYPGALARSVVQAYACATIPAKTCDASQAKTFPEWGSVADAHQLKRLDQKLTVVFDTKKTTLVAGSFFTIGSVFQALTKGNPGTLGVFSVVALVWSFIAAAAAQKNGNKLTPDVGLVLILALTYQLYRIANQAKRARQKKRKVDLERVRLEAEAERQEKKGK